MTQKERNEKLRGGRRALGLCPRCGGEVDDKRKKTCSACREKAREYQRAQTAEWKKAHRERVQEYGMRRYRERRDSGICTYCGKAPAREGKTMCQSCADLVYMHYKRREYNSIVKAI